MNSFYLTVTSGGDGHHSKANAPGNFRVHLGKVIELQGAYEVGLAEIHVPSTLYTTKKTNLKGGGKELIATTTTDAANPAVSLLHVECSLLEDQFMNHEHHKYLRTLNVKGSKYVKDTVKTHTFNQVFYYPVAARKISDIQINIITDSGKIATFESGTLNLLLHFRELTNNGH